MFDKMEQILTLFDIFGFNSGQSKLSRCRNVAKFILNIHILLATFFTLFLFFLLIAYYSMLNIIEAISEFLQYFTALCTYWIIILDSNSRWQEQRQLWQILDEIEKRSPQQLLAFNSRNYLIKFIEYFVITFFIILMIIFINDFNSFTTTIIYAYMLVIKLCQIRVFYYLFHIEIIHSQLNLIVKKLKLLKSSEINNEIKWIREHYYHVHEIVHIVNKIFGWSHVAGILFCFYVLLTDLNEINFHYQEISTIHLIGEFVIM